MPSLTTGAARSTEASAAKAASVWSRLLAGTLTTCVRIWSMLRPALPPCLAIAASFAALVALALNFTRMGTVGPSCGAAWALAWAVAVAAASVAVADGSGVAVSLVVSVAGAALVASVDGGVVGVVDGLLGAADAK